MITNLTRENGHLLQDTEDYRMQHPNWVESNDTYYSVFKGSLYAIYNDVVPWTQMRETRPMVIRFDKVDHEWKVAWEIHPQTKVMDIVNDLELFLVVNMVL